MKTNNEKITKEFCDGKILIFYPKTGDEAEFIQHKLFEMGFAWKSGLTEIGNIASCVLNGMELDGGKIYTSPPRGDVDKGFLCTPAQFNGNYLSPEQTFILEQFNKLAARIEDISRKVDAMYDQVMPKSLDKPVFKKPDSTP